MSENSLVDLGTQIKPSTSDAFAKVLADHKVKPTDENILAFMLDAFEGYAEEIKRNPDSIEPLRFKNVSYKQSRKELETIKKHVVKLIKSIQNLTNTTNQGLYLSGCRCDLAKLEKELDVLKSCAEKAYQKEENSAGEEKESALKPEYVLGRPGRPVKAILQRMADFLTNHWEAEKGRRATITNDPYKEEGSQAGGEYWEFMQASFAIINVISVEYLIRR